MKLKDIPQQVCVRAMVNVKTCWPLVGKTIAIPTYYCIYTIQISDVHLYGWQHSKYIMTINFENYIDLPFISPLSLTRVHLSGLKQPPVKYQSWLLNFLKI